MKRFLFLLLILLSILKTNAQPWAAPGATWYYSYDNFNYTGYVKIQKTGDTVVAGILCDRLERVATIKDLTTGFTSTSTLGLSFTYENNNVVYLNGDTGFYVLYDFNALPANSWTIFAIYPYPPCNPGTTTVDSIGTTTINSTSLLYFYSSGFNPGNYDLIGQTIQKIGNLRYLLPQPDCLIDVFEAYGLRCYSDSSGWSYSTGLAPSCNYITGINENDFSNQISIFPNPASTEFQISNFSFQTNDEILLRDVLGKIYYSKKINSPTSNFQILTSAFTNGIYFLEIKTNEGVLNKKVMVQHP